MIAMASQITGVSIVCSTACSGADQRKYHSSTSMALQMGMHQWPVDSPRSNVENVSIWWRHHGAAVMRYLKHYATSLGDTHTGLHFDLWLRLPRKTSNLKAMPAIAETLPDSKVHGANTGPTWGSQDPGVPRVGPWTLLSGEPLQVIMVISP